MVQAEIILRFGYCGGLVGDAVLDLADR